MDEPAPMRFRYTRTCVVPDCAQAPQFKVAAVWSDGPLRELKNYGLTCAQHLDDLLAHARTQQERVAMRDDEQLGPVHVITLDQPSQAG